MSLLDAVTQFSDDNSIPVKLNRDFTVGGHIYRYKSPNEEAKIYNLVLTYSETSGGSKTLQGKFDQEHIGEEIYIGFIFSATLSVLNGKDIISINKTENGSISLTSFPDAFGPKNTLVVSNSYFSIKLNYDFFDVNNVIPDLPLLASQTLGFGAIPTFKTEATPVKFDFKNKSVGLKLSDENVFPYIAPRTHATPLFGLDIDEFVFFLIDSEEKVYPPTWSLVGDIGLPTDVALPLVKPGQKLTTIYHKALPFHTEMLDEFASDTDYQSCVLANKLQSHQSSTLANKIPSHQNLSNLEFYYIMLLYVNIRLSLQYIFNPAGGIDNKYLQEQYYGEFIVNLLNDPRFVDSASLKLIFTEKNSPFSQLYKLFKKGCGYNPCLNV